MARNERTPLSPSATEALDALDGPAKGETGRSWETVIEELLDDEFRRADAKAAVTELQAKGYLYRVNGRLFVTPQ